MIYMRCVCERIRAPILVQPFRIPQFSLKNIRPLEVPLSLRLMYELALVLDCPSPWPNMTCIRFLLQRPNALLMVLL